MTCPAPCAAAEVQEYLDLHFCEEAEFAGLAGIELPLLHKLIKTGAAPRPSYIVREGKLISAAFGELEFSGLREGEYFRRVAASWVARTARFGSDAKADAYSSGVFSICIADIESVEGIVRKEILQEKLQRFANSWESSDVAPDVEAILQNISTYADSCMPFSPIEYPISSRKRLVEYLPRQLA